jgi:release factor glutamine methyltransferase
MTKPARERQRLDAQRSLDGVLKKVLSATSDVPPSIYAPSDDSLLMIEALANLQLDRKKVLDMGTGSGILGLYCATYGADVNASDVDELAIIEAGRAARTLGVRLKLLVSDLFSNVPGQFDLILFNPPYLPSKDCKDRTIDGGSEGTMLTNRFLDALPTHLDRGAQALLMVSSLNDPASVRVRHGNFEFSTVARRSLFFEELQVLRVRLRDDLAI